MEVEGCHATQNQIYTCFFFSDIMTEEEKGTNTIFVFGS